MAIETLAYRFQVRGGTAAALALLNEVPLRRELVFELDTGKSKVGDGVSDYNSLPYNPAGGPTQVISTTGAITLDAATHKGRMLLHAGAGPITCPATVAAGFVTDDIVEVRWQSGAQVELVAGSGAALDYNSTLFSPFIHHEKAVIALKVIAVDTWALLGPLADA